MAGVKRGPKTESGKQQSAQNAITHGARSTKITGPHEQLDYDIFLKELVDFYKPEGPLERLQLERIATCKAKLKSLYELEQAKQELLINEHESDTRKYIDQIASLGSLVQGMMKELFLFGKLILPCHLDIDLLTEIVSEINTFRGEINSDDEIKNYFPKLTRFLEKIDSNENALHRRLMAVGDQLQSAIDSGDNYSEGVKSFLPDRFKKVKSELTAEELAIDRELEEYQEQARQRRGEKYKLDIHFSEKVFPDKKKLTVIFNSFRTIQSAYLLTYKYSDAVRLKIELHKRALSLPIEEADLLMRYQTAWERRLSTLIGEFMQLQRIRLLQLGNKIS